MILLLFVVVAHAASFDQWKNRTIYQLLTDRFARPLNHSSPFGSCSNWNDYCGGTFSGIEQRLDYIQYMGFDAIWISPIPENTPGGYHGYWMKNLFQINAHFGTRTALRQLIDAAHKRNIYVMLDVVANHVGPVGDDFSSIQPFNDSAFFHRDCQIKQFNCFTKEIQLCRLSSLPDLNQSVPFVAEQLQMFVRGAVSHLAVDGLRIDTVPEVDRLFWKSFMNAANHVFAVGEVFSADNNCVAKYQQTLGGILSYPMYFAVMSSFMQRKSMKALTNAMETYAKAGVDIDRTGSFIGNHDNRRFLRQQQSVKALKAAIVWLMMSPGVPIFYYGDEQLFDQTNDRAPLWPTRFTTNTGIVEWLKTVVHVRKTVAVWNKTFELISVDDQFLAFARGDVALVLLTNQENQSKMKRSLSNLPFEANATLCNVFYPENDCIQVNDQNQLTVYLDNGETKIYIVKDRSNL